MLHFSAISCRGRQHLKNLNYLISYVPCFYEKMLNEITDWKRVESLLLRYITKFTLPLLAVLIHRQLIALSSGGQTVAHLNHN